VPSGYRLDAPKLLLSDVRRQTSDVRRQTSDVRRQTSDISVFGARCNILVPLAAAHSRILAISHRRRAPVVGFRKVKVACRRSRLLGRPRSWTFDEAIVEVNACSGASFEN